MLGISFSQQNSGTAFTTAAPKFLSLVLFSRAPYAPFGYLLTSALPNLVSSAISYRSASLCKRNTGKSIKFSAFTLERGFMVLFFFFFPRKNTVTLHLVYPKFIPHLLLSLRTHISLRPRENPKRIRRCSLHFKCKPGYHYHVTI